MRSEPLFFAELRRRISDAPEIWLADGPSERVKELLRKSALKPLVIFTRLAGFTGLTGRVENGGLLPGASVLSLRHSLARMHPDEIFRCFLDAFWEFPKKKILSVDSAIGEGLILKHGRVLGSRAKILPRKPGSLRRLPADLSDGSEGCFGSVESIGYENGALVIRGWCMSSKLQPIRELFFFQDGRELPVHVSMATRSLVSAGLELGCGESGFVAYFFISPRKLQPEKISVVGLDGRGNPFPLRSPALSSHRKREGRAGKSGGSPGGSTINARIDVQDLPDLGKCVITGWAADLARKGPFSEIRVCDERGHFLQSIPVREKSPQLAQIFGSDKFGECGIHAELPLGSGETSQRLRLLAVRGGKITEIPPFLVRWSEKRISLGPGNRGLFGGIITCVLDPESHRRVWIDGWVVHRKSVIRSLRLSVDGRCFREARLFDPYFPTIPDLVPSDDPGMPELFHAFLSVPSSAKTISPWFEARLENGKIERGRFPPVRFSSTAPFLNHPSAAARAKASENELELFLRQGGVIRFAAHRAPELSIVLVLHNKAEVTYRALRSLARYAPKNAEIVLVDNASEDRTPELLDRIRGARILRNAANLHFILGANQGARCSRGRYLLFMNNDCEVLSDTIQAALARLRSSPKIGVVGGKLLNPDLTLQEAGFGVRADGLGFFYGEGEDPEKPEFSFVRRVATCSGAFFLTRADLFRKLGGFDTRFRPAYFEDLDYCLRANFSGYDVVYEPEAVLIHLKHGSKKSDFELLRSLYAGQTRFRKFWSKKLARQPGYCWNPNLKTRRALVITRELFPPAAGSPRSGSARALARAIREIDDRETQVTVFPLRSEKRDRPDWPDWNEIRETFPDTVEVIRDGSAGELETFLESRHAGFHETHFGRGTERFLDRTDPSLRSRMGKPVPHESRW